MSSTEVPVRRRDDFSAGDVVQLKSGGPKMTVRAAGPDGMVSVYWFGANDDAHSGTFAAAALEKATK
jgi:uncharacterized protein YodC (DUF2158 family)